MESYFETVKLSHVHVGAEIRSFLRSLESWCFGRLVDDHKH